jgi:hypothetical protein
MNLWLTSLMKHIVRTTRPKPWVLLTALLILAILCQKLIGAAAAPQDKALVHATQAEGPMKAKNNDDGYVGSQACASCHIKIYNEYVQTSMGRSMSSIRN